mmetsp:Transcript_21735/g.47395  ORF Transcript_21735/g.47395 Transcript_21735/m.47395 type:complete len:364 (+) Transcript_21735:258-1349(+)
MDCDVIIAGQLYVGNYAAAQDAELLERLGITHIISAGFHSGHFDMTPRYRHLCLDVRDSPEENLLRHLPKVTSFIERAVDEDGGTVYVHCVHGQSRSCAICVAYLMRRSRHRGGRNAAEQARNNNNQNSRDQKMLLQECYDEVEKARPCMAINPGFVRQLEMYRRMICSIDTSTTTGTRTHNGDSTTASAMLPMSRAHAAFRSFRARSEYERSGCVSKWFPKPSEIDSNAYQCQKCRVLLYSGYNVIDEWTASDQSALPKSEYWAKSEGGLDYSRSKNAVAVGKNKTKRGDTGTSTTLYKVEPIDWMESQMKQSPDTGSSLLKVSGKLACPSCSSKIGGWDWEHSDPYCSLFITPSKVEKLLG